MTMETCWVIPIIVGLLCAILGYLLGRLWRMGADDWKSKYEETLAKLDECERQKKVAASTEAEVIASSGTNSSAFNAEEAKMVLGKAVKENDLTIVEGIGAGIAELLNKNGITTWEQLSKTPVAECKSILEKAGGAYTLHNPGTWPDQAALAKDNKWQELKKWQDELNGGV